LQRTDPRVADLVESGRLRAALFLPQYDEDAASGGLSGIGMGYLGITITRELAIRLGIDPVLVKLWTPAEAVDALKYDACDLAFLGITPARTADVDFTPPIIHFDFSCLVPAGTSQENLAEADRPGRRIAVVRHHASTIALRRMIKHAALVEADIPDEAFELLRAGSVDALAAPREHLLDYADRLPGSRIFADGYGVNRVAMALPKGRAGQLAYMSEFIEHAKASGLIARAIAGGGLHGFMVAPLQ
jgi:polar amino acid transport system substrate-binding protein